MTRLITLVIALALCSTIPAAQTTKTATKKAAPASQENAQAKFKAIWEPVNYKEDLNLTDVVFATDQIGWVAGEHGTILYTKDGGDTWTPQLGGNPKSADAPIHDLRLLDETHVWASQASGPSNKLLRTTDGQSWEQIGKLGDQYGYWDDYLFTSDKTGIQIRHAGQGAGDIAMSSDSGKTWKSVMPKCVAKMEVQGLTREAGCWLKSLHFPSANTGYAIGTGSKALVVGRTDDGGQNWKISVTPDVASDNSTFFRQETFFTSENTGFVTLDDRKILATSDGGQSWHAVVGTSRGKIKFADPDIGWSFDGSKLTYTTNGGKMWSAREFRFPAQVKAFCLSSRQRGYVVGDHGMIYRYRIVPIDYTAKGMMDAPAMPPAQRAEK